MLCRRAEGLFKSLITIQYDYTMQSASFSIPISAQICNISMNAAMLHRIICPPTAKFKQEDLQNRKRTGKQGKSVPTLLLAAARILPASHLASKVAWSHFSLVGEICPQAPLNDFCKIGCAPAELLRLRRVWKLRYYVNRSLTYSLFLGILETEKEVTQP